MFRKSRYVAMGALALSLAGGMCARAEVGTDGAVAAIALHDGLVWAEVDCGGKKLHFVVDTGAESSCVDLAAARRLDMRLGGAVDVAGVGGRTVGYECSGFQASVGGMRLPEEVVALDLSGPSRACRQEIDGLIGADFFRGKVVRIDYARGVLSREPAPGVARGTPLRFEGGVICVRVAVNGGEARWTRLDTGCTEALEWCAGADCRRNGSRESVALASLAARAIPAEVTVGTARLEDVPVKVRKRQIFPGEAGLLGNGVLSRYRVTIDGIEKRLVLE